MIKIEELKDVNVKEAQEMLQNDITEYTVTVAQMEMKELNDAEAALVNKLNEYDKYLDNVEYKLPKSASYNETNYSKGEICEMIAKLVDKQEVEFQYTLGMNQLVDFWKNLGREVTDSFVKYKVYDSTLRILGNMKFKGYEERNGILVINEFTSSAHDEYSINTSYLIYLSKLHSAVLDQMQKLSQTETAEVENV